MKKILVINVFDIDQEIDYFFPDCYEIWIHIENEKIEYMDGKSLKFQFKTKKAD